MNSCHEHHSVSKFLDVTNNLTHIYLLLANDIIVDIQPAEVQRSVSCFAFYPLLIHARICSLVRFARHSGRLINATVIVMSIDDLRPSVIGLGHHSVCPECIESSPAAGPFHRI